MKIYFDKIHVDSVVFSTLTKALHNNFITVMQGCEISITPNYHMRNRTRLESCKYDYEKYVIAYIVLPLKATVFAYPTTVKVYWPWYRLIVHRISSPSGVES